VYVNLAKTTFVSINLNPRISPVTPIIVTPTPGTGIVQVYVDHTGSTVCLDNSNCRTNVGGTASSATGTTLFYNVTTSYVHSISVTADGFIPYASQVSVIKDLITTVDVSLQPLVVDTTTPARTPAGFSRL